MICRQCPECGSKWYSASTLPWICDKCGTLLDNRYNQPREKQSGWDCWGDEIKSDINLEVMGKWPRN